MAGDMVWYKNNNPHHKARWLKAVIIKRFSKNIFQVETETGSVRLMAHRNQLRKTTNAVLLRPNITLSNQIPKVGQSNGQNEDQLGSLPEEEKRTTGNSLKRKHADVLSESPLSGLRRSKRKRTANVDSDFHYG